MNSHLIFETVKTGEHSFDVFFRKEKVGVAFRNSYHNNFVCKIMKIDGSFYFVDRKHCEVFLNEHVSELMHALKKKNNTQ